MSADSRRPSEAGSIPERPPTARGHRRPSSRRRHADSNDVIATQDFNDVTDYQENDVRPPRPSSRRRHRPDSAAMMNDSHVDISGEPMMAGYSQLTSLEQMAEMTSRPTSSYRPPPSGGRMSPTETFHSPPSRSESGSRMSNRKRSSRPKSRLGQRPPPPTMPPRDVEVDPFALGAHSPRGELSSDSDEGYVPSPRSRQQVAQMAMGGAEDYQSNMVPPRGDGQARPKSTKRRVQTSHRRHTQDGCVEGEEELPAMPVLRPPSSFSKYKPLPAIGDPTPAATPGPVLDDLDIPLTKSMADLSVLGDPASLGHQENMEASPYQVVIPGPSEEAEAKKKRQTSAGSSNSSYFPLATGRSLSSQSSGSGGVVEVDSDRFQPLDMPHSLPEEPQEGEPRVLLAVKLPTNGRRHQRHFRPEETLQTVLAFAENMANVNLSNFRLACNAPKRLFMDLGASIQQCGLQDRTALYLEENTDD